MAEGWRKRWLPAAAPYLAALGATIGIFLAGYLSEILLGNPRVMTLVLIAPMGAAAVLLFAAPHSPLAQPWPVIGGNTVSALVGLLCLNGVGYSLVGAAVAVGVAIAVMSLLRCLHPPGGAAALSAVLSGPMIAGQNAMFLAEVGINACLLLVVALLYNRAVGWPYPVSAGTGGREPWRPVVAVTAADLAASLDAHRADPVDRAGLDRLHAAATDRALRRRLAGRTVGDAMDREGVVVGPETPAREAVALLREHGLAALPVVDGGGTVVGLFAGGPALVPWRGRGGATAEHMRPPRVLREDAPLHAAAAALLADGGGLVPVVDAAGRIVGVVTPAAVERVLGPA